MLLGSAACQEATKTAPDSRSKAAVRPGLSTDQAGPIAGILQADAKSGCLWLGSPTAGQQVLLKGDGYAVDFNARPTAVRKDGHVVATVGQRVLLGGGLTAHEGRVERCPVGAARDPWVGAFVVAPQTASTPTTQATDEDASRRTLINWPDGAVAYEQGHAAVFACAVDGTKSNGSMDSYPPILAFLSVSEAAKRVFESCALAVLGTGLYVPG